MFSLQSYPILFLLFQPPFPGTLAVRPGYSRERYKSFYIVWLAACPTGRLATGTNAGSPDGQSSYKNNLKSVFQQRYMLKRTFYFSNIGI